MTEQDDIIMNQLYRFCHTGEGREGMANVLSHIFQREGGSCQGLHRFLFENEALPEIGAHLVAQLSLTDNHFFVGFMQQFAKELQFDNIHDYFDAQQMTADRKLTYAFMLGLGTENDRGIFKKITNALRFIPKPSTSDEVGIYDEEERNADKRIAEIDGELAMSKSQEQELMSIQEDEEEEMRQLKAKHDELRRLVKHRHTAMARRKHDAAADSSSEQTKAKLKKSARDKVISEEMFEDMLNKPYGPRKDTLGIIKSGTDKHGHTLYFDKGYVYCKACRTKVQYGSVVGHIVGPTHCKRVAKNLQEKQDVLQNLQEKQDADSVEGDEAEASDETTGQAKNPALPVNERMPQDTKRKTPKKIADEGGNERSQNALTEQGGLVVNSLDIAEYIRGLERRVSELEGLERRVSELERKLAAATSTENDDENRTC